jgi:CheY-like chemotaxis protein
MTKKVLVADDSPTIQKFISLALADEDVSVECVADGEQAVERIKTLRPDLVFADVLMPGINGYEICSGIKNDPELADTRIVLMVGTFEAFDEEAAASVKCDAHLTKPFDTSELIQLTHSLIPDHSAQTEASKSECAPETSISASTIDDFTKQTTPTLISSKTKESFMGSGRILELFTEKTVSKANSAISPAFGVQAETRSGVAEVKVMGINQSELATKTVEETGISPVQSNIQVLSELPDEIVDEIVERVIRRMSQEVIREIAWEVVPELSDVIIRQRLEELEKKS